MLNKEQVLVGASMVKLNDAWVHIGYQIAFDID